ncbi:hypothetical protein GCM10011351_30850 [Paraliobacillus quinghaiensis]|uniref:SSD domain-containing protein n=1 Tax=Paraliobacillus quinghaiensis TaxID=470815 RepID=A0A917TYH4_9BACI|nr:MMPL family transporter [Paraliobacillus quinghaiensis]GGM42733.1 hypothetical protein GCM10011351_30850 [Paraliobacillus quinghaiensis]
MNKPIQDRAKKSLNQTVIKMLPAILTALVATALGFIALYTSPVPMIQDFGKMLTVGMIVSFFVGVLILIPILFTRDHFFTKDPVKKKKASTNESMIERFLDHFTKKLVSFRWIILIVALITAGLGIWVDFNAGVETDIEKFMPQDTQELTDIHKLRDILGTTDQVSIVYEGEDILNQQTLEWVDSTTESLGTEFEDVVVNTKSITSILKRMNEDELASGPALEEQLTDLPENQLKLLINDTETKGVITVGIKHLEAEPLKAFIDSLNEYLSEESLSTIETTITGKAVLDVEMISALTTGRYKMTLLGIALVFLGLLAIYRHPVKAFIPLLPIIFIIGWSGAAMFLLGIKYTPLTATLGALVIGIGTEFTILMMERFYEERRNGHASVEAIRITNKKIGKAIFASAITTVGGFSALLISDFVILSNFGLMTLINILLALFSSIVVMPAILIILDRFVKIRPIG